MYDSAGLAADPELQAANAAIAELSAGLQSSPAVSLQTRQALCQECLLLVAEHAAEWGEVAARAKGLAPDAPAAAEELLSGPVVVARQLRLSQQTLHELETLGRPQLPGRLQRLSHGRVAAPVFPTRGNYDLLTFLGVSAAVHLQATAGAAFESLPPICFGERVAAAAATRSTGITAVLGAGNVSSIPATDSLQQILFGGRRVILKLHPVNSCLAPVFRRVFAPLLQAGLLRIVTGGPATGGHVIHHPAVQSVHLTGSHETHDAIVWGPQISEQQTRRMLNTPLLQKPVTSELGNVTPWIILPGHYTRRQLLSQARHVAASITNNASFNCVATKLIVTWKHWEQRAQFLQLVQQTLQQTPQRAAWYPGAVERFRRFAHQPVPAHGPVELPWVLLTDQTIDNRPDLFTEESFVCVAAETSLEAPDPEQFCDVATDFVNQRLPGSLCASVTVPPAFRRRFAPALDRCVRKLRYGTVCLNQWSGLAYALVSPPWGAYPGETLSNARSGIGHVHNTYLLDGIEKTVLDGPLINFPHPVWLPSHRSAGLAAARLLQLYVRPSSLKLLHTFMAAIHC